MMTNAFPVNGELAGHSLTWQCPAALDLPREAVECFQRGVELLQLGDSGGALVVLSRSTELAPAFSEAHVFLGLANALSNKIYPAIDHLELAAQLQPDPPQEPLHRNRPWSRLYAPIRSIPPGLP